MIVIYYLIDQFKIYYHNLINYNKMQLTYDPNLMFIPRLKV